MGARLAPDLVVRRVSLHPSPEIYPMSGIICSHGGHRISGQIAKAFSSAYTPLHLCRPGNLTSLLRAAQSKKALLPIYFNEGGMASSVRAAQFMKALTRMVWRVIGSLTSLRLVQWTKYSCISTLCELERSTFLSRWQLSQACAPTRAAHPFSAPHKASRTPAPKEHTVKPLAQTAT